MDKIKSDILTLLDQLHPVDTDELVDEIRKAEALREIAEKVNGGIEKERNLIRNHSKDQEDLVKRLESNTASIKEEIADLEAVAEKYKYLSAEEEKIKSDHQKLKEEHKKLEELKKLDEFLSSNNIESLRSQITQIQTDTQIDVDLILGDIETAASHLKGIENDYSKLLSEQLDLVRHSIKKIQNGLFESIATLEMSNVDIENAFSEQEAQLNNNITKAQDQLKHAKQQHDSLVTKMQSIKDELEKIENNHAKNVDSYKKHFDKNKNIWGNIDDKHQLNDYVENLTVDIERLLNSFDNKLKVILQDRENIHISKLQ